MEESIGEKLKIARIRKKLTLQTLSEKCGLSRSFISQIERGEARPSLASLTKIVRALEISLWSLFSENQQRPLEESQKTTNLPHIYFSPNLIEGYISRCQMVKKNRRKSIIIPDSNIKYSMVTPDLNRKMQILNMIAQPGEDSGKGWFTHEGEECCYVVRGRIEIQVGDEVFQLEEGDSLYFPSTAHHRWRNVGENQLELIWTMTPPSF
ncbi:MAG: cupin domain-containing protein [Proteobacteria bacterium]|nr:cupin domain-containing protein [Pseudomonadota bacterium]